jgi:hypothetical protein
MFLNILIIFIAICSSIFPETVILKDGTIQKGKVKSQNIDFLVLNIKGKDSNISKAKIRRVIYAITPEQEEKQTKEELAKLKLEKNSKVKKTKEEEAEEAERINFEITKALEEQEKQEKLNLSFTERIKDLEAQVYELRSNNNLSDSGSRLNKVEEEVKDLKSRTRRIERFLSIDPDMEEYYTKPRTMWSVVWRSALIPGWGLTYAKDSFGGIYTSLFLVSGLGAAGMNASVNALEKKFNDKLINDYIIQPYLIRTLSSSSTTPVTAAAQQNLEGLINLNSTNKLFGLYKIQRDIADQKDATTSFNNAVAGIYALQLIHSIIVGYFWARKIPGKLSDIEAPKSSLYINMIPPTRLNMNSEYQLGVNHRF